MNLLQLNVVETGRRQQREVDTAMPGKVEQGPTHALATAGIGNNIPLLIIWYSKKE